MFAGIWMGMFNLKVCIPLTSKSTGTSDTIRSHYPLLSSRPMKQPLFQGHLVSFLTSTGTRITCPGSPSTMDSGLATKMALFWDHLDLYLPKQPQSSWVWVHSPSFCSSLSMKSLAMPIHYLAISLNSGFLAKPPLQWRLQPPLPAPSMPAIISGIPQALAWG